MFLKDAQKCLGILKKQQKYNLDPLFQQNSVFCIKNHYLIQFRDLYFLLKTVPHIFKSPCMPI